MSAELKPFAHVLWIDDHWRVQIDFQESEAAIRKVVVQCVVDSGDEEKPVGIEVLGWKHQTGLNCSHPIQSMSLQISYDKRVDAAYFALDRDARSSKQLGAEGLLTTDAGGRPIRLVIPRDGFIGMTEQDIGID